MTREDKKIIREFTKRFASGEQNIKLAKWISPINGISYEIRDINKSFFWIKDDVYNLLMKIVEWMKQIGVKDSKIFGADGFVYNIHTLQQDYNTTKNNILMMLERAMYPNLIVEDDSVDIDNLQEEGLSPGKALIYRQGSETPRYANTDSYLPIVLDELRKEELRLYEAIHLRAKEWGRQYGEYNDKA